MNIKINYKIDNNLIWIYTYQMEIEWMRSRYALIVEECVAHGASGCVGVTNVIYYKINKFKTKTKIIEKKYYYFFPLVLYIH